MEPSRDISTLIEIMAQLRTPDGGCPWDLEQTFATIAPYTIEEAYEVADAIERGDFDQGLPDELGGCCSRSSSMRVWPKSKAVSILATWCSRSPRNLFGAIRMCSAAPAI
jgi:hypothetical protein